MALRSRPVRRTVQAGRGAARPVAGAAMSQAPAGGPASASEALARSAMSSPLAGPAASVGAAALATTRAARCGSACPRRRRLCDRCGGLHRTGTGAEAGRAAAWEDVEAEARRTPRPWAARAACWARTGSERPAQGRRGRGPPRWRPPRRRGVASKGRRKNSPDVQRP